MQGTHNQMTDEEVILASRDLGDGLHQTILSIPAIHCGGCVSRIEKAFGALNGVEAARVNLSTKRAAITWRSMTPPPIAATLSTLGFEGHLQSEAGKAEEDSGYARLLRATAVAGFGAMNIMGLSVAIWSGAAGETRDLFHWISAVIALGVLIYSGRIFFASAWNAVRHGGVNMDVPISVGIIITYALSLYDTMQGDAHAYFDATVSLIFILLIGRTLDHMMRDRARSAVVGLQRLTSFGATVLSGDGSRQHVPVEELAPGDVILLAAGERVPTDAVVLDGQSDIELSLVTGESTPESVGRKSLLRAGTLNLTGPLTIRATAAADNSFLAEMIRLMEAAESGRGHYRRIADRAARLYAPVVHIAAALAFAIWFWMTGDWHRAATIAVAVLIITCPCGLGLAVPMVQVVAARRLFDRGIMVKDGSALERLAEVDTVLFDKTGTLTTGQPILSNRSEILDNNLTLAGAIAVHSKHPQSLALATIASAADLHFDKVSETPGLGVEALWGGEQWRLGRADWALNRAEGQSGTVLSHNGQLVQAFAFADQVREDAATACASLRAMGLNLAVYSGDRADMVAGLADQLGIAERHAAMMPGDKLSNITALQAVGHRALMVGDGLNDAPALTAAHVSMAPGNAADIGRQAADFVFLRPSLDAVPFAVRIAHASNALVRNNITLAIGYNVIAVPLAFAGLLTPLIAALAMSGSSILVVANAMRLSAGEKKPFRLGAQGKRYSEMTASA